MPSIEMLARIKELESENSQLKKDLEHARSYKHTIKMRNRNLHTENERLKAENLKHREDKMTMSLKYNEVLNNLNDENEKLKGELEKVKNIVDCKIRLVLRPKYLMDILSIREWNDFVTSYEKDDNVTIHDNMDKYIAFDTTLGNIVNNHSLLDLRFVSQDSVLKEDK